MGSEKRADIPAELRAKAERVGPAFVRWLEAAYDTDMERARRVRDRRGQGRQLQLPVHDPRFQ